MTAGPVTVQGSARRNAAPEARVLAGLAQVDPADWDRLVPIRAGGLRHAFLRAWERAELDGRVARPIVVPDQRGEGLGAAAAGYHYDLDLATVSVPILPGASGSIRRLWPRFMKGRVYELGAPAARHDPLLVAPGMSVSDAAQSIVTAAVREAREAGSPMIVVQDFVPDRGPFAAALQQNGFGRVVTLPSFVVEVRHERFDDYLDAMRSKYRNRARRVFRDSRHLSAELIDDFAPLADELAELWRLVYERADETKREVMGAEFFRAAAVLCDMRALVLRRADGSIA
ncbi:MAG TPA: hypothetical protein VFP55_13500, partial [Solirubrobacteraceae bacterium]|nr:hypothetical protein [Solirubrobacteraceae bacterium]